MAKYSRKTGDTVAKAMRKMKKGTLKSGPGGKGGKVKSRKQAVAIALSEAREKGYKAPSKKAGRKSAAKKASAKKSASRRAPAKKSAAKKVSSKKSATRRTPAKKAAAKKRAVKKTPGRSSSRRRS